MGKFSYENRILLVPEYCFNAYNLPLLLASMENRQSNNGSLSAVEVIGISH